MTRPTAIDIAGIPEIARLAREVSASGRPRLLRENGEDLAILLPVPPHARGRKPGRMTAAQREAVLAAVGAWQGFVDAERLEQELDAARGDDRPAVEL